MDTSTGFLFPGQGAQQPGMLHALPDHPSVCATLSEASAVLGSDALGLDTADALRSTVAVQLALLISGVAMARALIAEGVRPLAVAGMSAGAYPAAVISGALAFPDSLRLLRQRAEMMAGLYPSGYGLSVIIGLSEREVLDIVNSVATANRNAGPLYISSINAPRQIGLAGSDAAMEQALELACARGARKAVRLNVAVPSHCPLLDSVAEALGRSVAEISIHTPQFTYVGNITGRALRSGAAVAADCAGNVARPIRWHDATSIMQELGCSVLIEMPPGHILSDLAKEAIPEIRTVALSRTSLDYAVKISKL